MSNSVPPLTISLIEKARAFLAGRIRRTPMEESPALSAALGVPVWLKLESAQVTGSFKIRGASFRLSLLTEEEKRAGIATCSAGNHGKAVAYAARSLGLVPTIYVPASVDESKYRAIVELGAEVIRSRFPGYDDTEEWAIREAERSGRVWISAFDDEAIMAGNGGSLALEILEDAPDARGFVLPVGGGGMSGGLAFTVRRSSPARRSSAASTNSRRRWRSRSNAAMPSRACPPWRPPPAESKEASGERPSRSCGRASAASPSSRSGRSSKACAGCSKSTSTWSSLPRRRPSPRA